MPSNIELIIFDLDGTLVNSIYDITDSLNKILATFDYGPIDYTSAKNLVGGGTLKLIQKAFAERVDDEGFIDRAHTLFKEDYIENLTTKTRFYEGVPEVLEHFRNKKKAVLSNKPHPLTQKIIKNLNLDHYFDMVLGANEKLYQKKPHNEGILHILSKLGVRPENAIIVGDSTHDIHAGKSAGISTCAVTYGYRSREALSNEGPDYLIDHISELSRFLG